MRIVWASSNLPDPSRGGGAALEHELLRRACDAHDVVLVTGGLLPDDDVPAVLRKLDLTDVVAAGALRRPQPSRSQMLLRSLAGPPLEFWMAGPKVASVRREVLRCDADLVHVMWAESAPVAIAAAERGPTAFLATDSFTRHEERELALAGSLRQRVYHRLQLRLARRWERAYRAAGAVAAISPLDADVMRSLGVDAGVVPSALGDEWFEPPTVERRGDLVSFVAALDYGPNDDAAHWLLDEVWPLLRTVRPETRLAIVGRNPSAELVRGAAAAGATLHADVDDVRPHYWRSDAVLIPVRLGSGTRTKVLHAMACRAPLVATRAAVESLPVVSGQHALLADDAAGLAAATAAALDDPEGAASRAAAAAEIADEHRTDRVAHALDELWDRACAAGGR